MHLITSCIYCSLKNKKAGLDRMRDACLEMTETFANKTYEKEHSMTRRIFQQVKDDLVTFVLYFVIFIS